MVRVNGVVLEDDRAGRKAEKCKGIGLVDEAGNLVGQIWFETNEIRLQLDPRINITLEAGGKEIKREMSPYRVGPYYDPIMLTVENNSDIIERHRAELYASGIQFDKNYKLKGRSYQFATRSR